MAGIKYRIDPIRTPDVPGPFETALYKVIVSDIEVYPKDKGKKPTRR